MSRKDNKVVNLINNAKSIAIMPSKVAGADSYSAAVGLYFMLLDKDKEVYFVHQGKIPDQAEGLIERNRISQNVTQKDLVVSVDYSNTPAASAQYASEGDVLKIKLGPVPRSFDLSRISARLEGFESDLLIVIGAQNPEALGGMFREIKEEFRNVKVVNIDNTRKNVRFGDVNVIDSSALTLSNLIFSKAPEWNLTPNERAAQALLTGMTYRNPS